MGNLYDLGLSVSYDRVLSISTDLGKGVSRRFEEEKVVCPTNLRKKLFTTAAIANIDHNPSSTTASDSFHGTGIIIITNFGELNPNGTSANGTRSPMRGTLPYYTQYILLLLNRLHATVNINTCQLLGARTSD